MKRSIVSFYLCGIAKIVKALGSYPSNAVAQIHLPLPIALDLVITRVS